MARNRIKYIIGIDEVGRGPLAGPVAVGAVFLPVGFPRSFYKGVRDSKKLSPQIREEWCQKIEKAAKEGKLKFAVSFVGHNVIDKKGLSYSIKKALSQSLKKLDVSPEEVKIFLDGGLKAPPEFKNQETVIKGDDKIPAISLASIVAKVARDKRMVQLSEIYPNYGFHSHKGYGTYAHCVALKKYGLCPIHRRSFLIKFQQYRTSLILSNI